MNLSRGNLFSYLTKEQKLLMWREMCLARELELKIRWCVKESGEAIIPTVALISLWEEAVAVGASFALDPKKDWLVPGHRSMGALIHFGITPEDDLANHMCKANSIMRGREGNVHYGKPDRHIVRFISHMLGNWPAGGGVARGLKYIYEELEAEKHTGEELPVVLCFCGDGASAQGVFHEVVRYAAVQNLPIGFIINNNHVATDTEYGEETAALHLSDAAGGENILGTYVDGHNVVEVYNAAARLIGRAREVAREPIEKLRRRGDRPAPFILECNLAARVSEHNETRFAQCVDPHEFAEARARDPIELFRTILLRIPSIEALKRIKPPRSEKFLAAGEMEIAPEELEKIMENAKRTVEEDYKKARAMADPQPDASLLEVFPALPHELEILIKRERTVEPFDAFRSDDTRIPQADLASFVSGLDALRGVLEEEALANPKITFCGEDVGGRIIDGEVRGGGVFSVTSKLLKNPLVGPKRVWNTPLAELAIVGAGIGQALVGLIPIVEIQYLPFATVAATQFDYYLPMWQWSLKTPVHAIFRMPCGGGSSSGEYHSSMRLEASFYHSLGLKIVHPTTPNDIVGLMRGAIRDNAPIIFLESIWGYTNVRGKVRNEIIPIGPAALRKRGTDITIVAWGAKPWFDAVLPAVEELETRDNASIELIDLRTLAPLDYGLELITESVKKTGRLLIVHEDVQKGGVGESVALAVMQETFYDLIAKPEIVAGPSCFLPQHPVLEKWFLPSSEKVAAAARRQLAQR